MDHGINNSLKDETEVVYEIVQVGHALTGIVNGTIMMQELYDEMKMAVDDVNTLMKSSYFYDQYY